MPDNVLRRGGWVPIRPGRKGEVQVSKSDPDQTAVNEADDTVTYDANQLIPNGIKAEIVLNGQSYTLRITRAGKLILTK